MKTYVAVNSNVYAQCKTIDCPGVFMRDSGVASVICATCKKEVCSMCTENLHPSLTCAQAKDLDKLSYEYINELFNKKLAQKCPKCGAITERIDGCNFLTCVCKQDFCFLCWAPLDASKHFSHFNNEPFGSSCKGPTDKTG